MLEKYAIVPFILQAERSPSKKERESEDLSHRYGLHFLRFLEPLVRELDVTVDKRPSWMSRSTKDRCAPWYKPSRRSCRSETKPMDSC